ncbi:FAD:protein FMN transferase [Muribaculaceae bacterium Isolate-002 (NCI)]|nr:FAD:protein FMN transferase [Muribaculaceae bacterium Isolate-002 (NCI)]
MLKIISHLTAAAVAAVTVTGCSGGKSAERYTSLEGNVWHTTMHITYGSERDLSEEVTDVTKRVEESLSPFLPDSRISRINHNSDMATDGYIEQVLAESQRVNRLSGGAFDPTVAPLVNLWGFGYSDEGGEPSQEQIDSCLSLVGIADCRIEDGMMIKKSPGTQFNFSAITKGFGIDCIAGMLRDEGVKNYMIEIGGEVALSGVNSRGEKWHIQIDSPASDASGHERLSVIEVTDCCIATSGNYRNYRDTSHGRIGHTISPSDGKPYTGNVLSATVIAPSTMTADALATALMAMDAEARMSMIEGLDNVEALLVVADGDGFRLVKSSGFPEMKQ